VTASELVARAKELCRRSKRTFPAELGGYACAWQREAYDLSWCWTLVKVALRRGQALWQVDAAVRSRYADLKAAREARERSLCKPVLTSHASSTARQRSSQGSLQAAPLHSDFDRPEDDDIEETDFWPAPRYETEVSPPARQNVAPAPVSSRTKAENRTMRSEASRLHAGVTGRTDTKANRVRQFLRVHVLRDGPIAATKLERLAKNERLLREDQPISRCSTFRRVAEELNIESKRYGFGSDGSYQWRQMPPAWASSDHGRRRTDGCP
jgi:hypothetical protein